MEKSHKEIKNILMHIEDLKNATLHSLAIIKYDSISVNVYLKLLLK
jgi:hypothetical protein